MTCTILSNATIPSKFWVDDTFYAVYIINRLSLPVLRGISPFEKLFQTPPDYNFLKVFGCECFPYVSFRTSNKLDPRSVRYVFLAMLLIIKDTVVWNQK